MRLLHVVPTYVPAWRHGGSVAAVHGLCKSLVARGHEVTVFTTDVHGAAALDVPRATPVSLDGVTVWYFPVASPRRLYRSPALGAALALHLREAGRCDLAHLHSVFLWPTAAAARTAERTGIPYLLTPHGALVGELLRRRGRLRKRLWIRLVERRTLANAAALHVTSQLEADEAMDLGLPLPPVYVVPFGIEAERWDPAREAELAPAVRTALARRPLLLFLGRLSWKKGLDRLLAALAQVPSATLAVAGNDEEGYRPRLDRLAAEAGVTGRVVFLGPVHGADKAGLLQSADALVLPSYSENFAIVVLEAMAAGLPVVVTPEVGLARVVSEHGAGVVADGDPSRLAAALRGLLADPDARRAMAQRGVEAARRFGWETVAARMEEVYGEVLARQRSRPGAGLAKTAGVAAS
ncbi:MAG TPA: glycosyltransferase [Thermoanaerobaculia bacterium]|nr:glycosyltransferase [Thermoanaerobaculia bacterium]